MKLAERVREIDVSGIRKLFESAGPGSINLGLGQPDFITPDHIREAAIQAIRDGKTGYTNNTGIIELREAIAGKLQRENELVCSPEQIIVTAGASEALHIVMQAIVDNGDRVLLADPGFVSYASLARIAGGRPEGVPLNEGLHIDVEKAKALMDGARLFILNSPANPTGMVEDRENIRSLVEYAMDARVTVVSDEVYEHFIYGAEHASAARFGDDVITINAASKTYAMTGWRLGFLAAPEEYITPCVKVHQYCQACATSISQYAALAAYTGDQKPVAAMRREYEVRRDIIWDGFRGMGIQFPKPEGAFYAFVPMGQPLIERVLGSGVVIVPGSAFGKNAPGYARLSYSASRDMLDKALARIRSVL
jgi:aspartate aminotransferase